MWHASIILRPTNSVLIAPAFVNRSRNSQIVRASGTRSESPRPRKRMNESRSSTSKNPGARPIAANRPMESQTGENGEVNRSAQLHALSPEFVRRSQFRQTLLP